MKGVLISIRPKWVEKICHKIGEDETGKAIYEKRIEVRISAPPVPFKAYIYCTKGKPYLYRVDDDDNFELTNMLRPKVDGYVKDYNEQNGKVIGEFICDKVYPIKNQGSRFSVADEEQGVTNKIARQSCLDYDDMVSYFGDKNGYGLHISDLKIYDKPRELSEFFIPCKGQGCNKCDWEREYDVCACAYKKPITRAPQSYMYVEGLREE